MEAITPTLITVGAVNLLMFPLLAFVLKRYIGRKLDRFDEKREAARERSEADRRESRAWREAMTAGMRSLLRAEIISEHRKWTAKGRCPLGVKEYITRCHTAYVGVGGNDIGDALYDQIMKLPAGETDEE